MFTGIVETTSPILSTLGRRGIRHVRIEKPARWRLSSGESIAVDGICSTVVAHRQRSFNVEYTPETLSKTTASFFVRNTKVNLERSLVYGGRIEGHLMQGHVDARARVVSILKKGRSRELAVSAPLTLMKSLTLHGSVAINGVSLTVARVRDTTFIAALIPHTIRHTNLGRLSVGDLVNVEVDRTTSLARKLGRDTVDRYAAKRVRKKEKNR